MNLLEVHATVLRRLSPTEARELSLAILSSVVHLPAEIAFSAPEFRQEMRSRKRGCSYIDALGYSAAAALKLPCLTGDPSFKGLDNVEFVR